MPEYNELYYKLKTNVNDSGSYYHTMCAYCNSNESLQSIDDTSLLRLFIEHNTLIDPKKYRYCVADNCCLKHTKLCKGIYYCLHILS